MSRTSLSLPNNRIFLVTSAIAKSEALPYIICLCVAVVFATLTVRDVLRQRQLERDATLGAIVPGINATALLAGRTSFLGSSKSPYTLVEFGDYQCPYCKLIQKQISVELDSHKDVIKLDFRQFPLYAIHPHAEEAALVAESARPSGKFWTVNEQLFATNLSKNYTAAQWALVNVVRNRKIARQQISLDSRIAKQLSVNATPSFFLCQPDGSVVRLPRLQALDLNIKEK